ncbi:MAG: DUF4097 family beta strand repeat-containing protein [Turicibacter sp.]|nr:DUF4097 family beta strand repeat-containing protein [Turicibacter sp.]
MKINEKMRILRKQRGMSQEDLATALYVSRQTVSRWELGECQPDLNCIVQISDIFGVTTDFLLREDAPARTEQSENGDADGENRENRKFAEIEDETPKFSGFLMKIGEKLGSYIGQTQTIGKPWPMLFVVGVVTLFVVASNVLQNSENSSETAAETPELTVILADNLVDSTEIWETPIAEARIIDINNGNAHFNTLNQFGRTLSQSGSFWAEDGQSLFLEFSSDIRGGTIEFYLIDPTGEERRFLLGDRSSIGENADDNWRTLITSATEGFWEFRSFGMFLSGNFAIIGTLSPAAIQAVPVHIGDTNLENIVIDLNNGSERIISQSGSFWAEDGQSLFLEIISNIRGGTVDLFLFDPTGREQHFTIDNHNQILEISLTEGVWAFNAFGRFSAGNISIIGTLQLLTPSENSAFAETPTADFSPFPAFGLTIATADALTLLAEITYADIVIATHPSLSEDNSVIVITYEAPNVAGFPWPLYRLNDSILEISQTEPLTNQQAAMPAPLGRFRVFVPTDMHGSLFHAVISTTSGNVTILGDSGFYLLENLLVNTTSGRIYGLHFKAKTANFTAVSGEIHLSNSEINDSLFAQVMSGDIILDEIFSPNITLDAGSGTITASHITAHDMEAQIDSGLLEIEDLHAANLIARGNSGDISLKNSNITGDIIIQTTTGDINFCNVENLGVSIQLNSESGNVIVDEVTIIGGTNRLNLRD